jgi:hypothetical protein
MNIKSFKSFNENFEQVENNDDNNENYMFFNNIKAIRRLSDRMLKMDQGEIDKLLIEHDWASDHASVAKENIEQIFNFFASKDEEYNKEIYGDKEGEDNSLED